MAKPVVRSNWKIDPAELALAQERTEARLANLFEHPASGGPGHRPAIVVDGVPLIGSVEDAREPLPPAVSAPDVTAGSDTDVVGVADMPGAELLEVTYEQQSDGDLVGVMPREIDIVPASLRRCVAPRSAVA